MGWDDSRDIVDELGDQHDRLTGLLDTAFATTGTARYRVVRQLRAELARHLAAEHRVLDPVVRRQMECGRDVLAILRGYEDRMRALLGRLDGLGDYADEYTDILAGVEVLLTAHVAVADGDVYPVLRDALTLAERRDLATDLTAAAGGPDRAGGRSFWRFGPLRQTG